MRKWLFSFLLLLLVGAAAAHAADSCMRATYYSRGLALDKIGKHDRAIEEYSLAIAADRAMRRLTTGAGWIRPKGHFDRETKTTARRGLWTPMSSDRHGARSDGATKRSRHSPKPLPRNPAMPGHIIAGGSLCV